MAPTAPSEQRMTAAIVSSEQRIIAAIASSEQRMTAQLDRLEALLLARASDSTSSAGRRLTASSAMGVTRPTGTLFLIFDFQYLLTSLKAGPSSAGAQLTVPSAIGSSSVTRPTGTLS